MLEKLLERLQEIEKLFDQAMANLNALAGAKDELKRVIALHEEAAKPAEPLSGEVV